MTNRRITVAGIALILLIAIGITIALGGEANATPVSVGAHVSRALGLEQLDHQQLNLALSRLDETAACLNVELNSGLNSGLNSELNSLTASASGHALRLDSADRLHDVAVLNLAADNLNTHLELNFDAHLLNA